VWHVAKGNIHAEKMSNVGMLMCVLLQRVIYMNKRCYFGMTICRDHCMEPLGNILVEKMLPFEYPMK
jgi:hypothetical protein